MKNEFEWDLAGSLSAFMIARAKILVMDGKMSAALMMIFLLPRADEAMLQDQKREMKAGMRVPQITHEAV